MRITDKLRVCTSNNSNAPLRNSTVVPADQSGKSCRRRRRLIAPAKGAQTVCTTPKEAKPIINTARVRRGYEPEPAWLIIVMKGIKEANTAAGQNQIASVQPRPSRFSMCSTESGQPKATNKKPKPQA